MAVRRSRQRCLSLSGYGEARRYWSPSDVAMVGRVLEVRRSRFGAVPARRHAFDSAGFSGRPICLEPELVEIIASERWETDPSFPSRLLSSHSWKKVMVDSGFSTTTPSELKPGPCAKQPCAQHTASRDTTTGYYDSGTIFQLCSASTVDDPSTSDSLSRSDVLPRCVWRATSGSASDGYQASSTAVTGAAENMTVHMKLPGVS